MTPQDAVAVGRRPISRFALFAAAVLPCGSPASAQTAARITAAVDDSVRVVLADSIHPRARPEFAHERVDPLPPSATAVAGTFTYSPPAGTVLPVGRHRLSVHFTPGDATDFNSVSAQIQIEVRRPRPKRSR